MKQSLIGMKLSIVCELSVATEKFKLRLPQIKINKVCRFHYHCARLQMIRLDVMGAKLCLRLEFPWQCFHASEMKSLTLFESVDLLARRVFYRGNHNRITNDRETKASPSSEISFVHV